MGFLTGLFGGGKKGKLLYEIPSADVVSRLPEIRTSGLFTKMKQMHPSIEDEHLSVVIGFSLAARQHGVDGSAFLMDSCKRIVAGELYVATRKGKHCLYSRIL